MKYGLIKNGRCIYYGNDNLGKWQGYIEYNEKGERLTAAEMIAKYQLKPIITPSNFNGKYSDYNAVEETDKITLTILLKNNKLILEKNNLLKENAELCKYLNDTNHVFINNKEDLQFGDLPSYFEDELAELHAIRKNKRTTINQNNERIRQIDILLNVKE